MKQSLALILLVLVYTTCYSQSRKTLRIQPEICMECKEMDEDGARKVRGIVSQKQVTENNIRGYKEIELKRNRRDGFDTTRVFFYTYHDNGLLQQEDA